jgi:hypothetical protein
MGDNPKADPVYAWQRFWVPREGSIDLSDGGFLRDPQSENPPSAHSEMPYGVQQPVLRHQMRSPRRSTAGKRNFLRSTATIASGRGVSMPTPQEYLEGFVDQAHSRLNGLLIGTEISVKSLIDLQASLNKRQRDVFPIDASVIGASSKDSLLENIIDERIASVMRMKPSKYLQYLGKTLHSSINEELIKKFSEIAVTRDLVIHINGKITPEYIAKSGKYARGKLGQTIAIYKSYFEQSIKAIDALYGHIDAALLAQGQKDSRITDEVIRLLRDSFFERFFS